MFPMLALAGGILYLFDPVHFVPFTAGLVLLGIWLSVLLFVSISANAMSRESTISAWWFSCSTSTPTSLAQSLLALPNWVAVATAVVSRFYYLTGREQLHELARGVSR